MRIAINHTRFTAAGGVERSIHTLAVRLALAGHEVHFVCARADEPPPIPAPGRLLIRRVPWFRSSRPLKVLSFARASARLFEREPFDLIHGFSKTWRQDVYTDGSGTAAAYRRFRLETAPDPLSRLARRLDAAYPAVLHAERRRFEDPGLVHVIAMSRLVEADLLATYPALAGRTGVIHNGVDTEAFHPERAAGLRPAIRAELGLPDKTLALLFLGNDYGRKGLDLALQALARHGEASPDPVLLVAGRDNRERGFRRLAGELGVGDRVRWLGPRRDVERLHAAADAFLFPTRFDVFGNVVLEAMASGVVPIVSRRAGAAEVVTDGEDGLLLADPTDLDGMADALRRLRDEEGRRHMAVAARRTAEAHAWDRHFEQVEAVHRAVLARRGGARPAGALR